MNGPSKLSQLPDKTSSTAAGAGAASGAAGYKSPQAQANQGFPSGYAAEASYSAPTQYNQAYPTQGQGQGQYGQQGGAMYSQAPQTSQAPHVNTDMSDRYVFCIDQIDLFFNLFMKFPILLRFILTLFLCDPLPFFFLLLCFSCVQLFYSSFYPLFLLT